MKISNPSFSNFFASTGVTRLASFVKYSLVGFIFLNSASGSTNVRSNAKLTDSSKGLRASPVIFCCRANVKNLLTLLLLVLNYQYTPK